MPKQVNKRSDEYKSVFGNRASSNHSIESNVDWAIANSGNLQQLITTVASRGGAIRFGYTRDGGAYAVGLYYGSESKTVYCRPGEDLEAFLEEWRQFYEDLPNTRGKSPEEKQQ